MEKDFKSPAYYGSQFARLLRPQMSVIPFALYISVLIYSDKLALLYTIAGYVLLIVSYGVVVIANDLSDREVDVVNRRKDIAYANGDLDKIFLVRGFIVLVCIGAIVSIALGYYVALWYVIYLMLGWLYSGSVNLKSKSMLALSVLAFCYGVMPWLLGMAVARIPLSPDILLVMLASFVYVYGIISLKDFKDVTGDRQYKKNTFLVKYGIRNTHRLIMAGTLSGYTILLVYAVNLMNYWFCLLIVVSMIANFIMLRSNKVTQSATYRGKYGSLSRLLFVVNAIILTTLF